jgi:hypothetical protein
MPEVDDDTDDQDLAEVFDETNTTTDGYDIADPDMAPDVYDVTAADDDEDEDEPADPDEFDPDALDEDERERMLEEDDGVDQPHVSAPDEADLVLSDEDNPEEAAERDDELDERLDDALEGTFPASDPFDLSRNAD